MKQAVEKTEEKDMTIKQRKWLKLYLECGSATEAAMQAYDTKDRNSASQIGWENLRKLDYASFLEEAGITDNLLQQKILEGLGADKPIGALVLIKNGVDGKPEQILKDNEGMIQVADHSVRHKYLETALKLKRRGIEDSNQALPDINITVTRGE